MVPSLSQATQEASPCSMDNGKDVGHGRLQILPLTRLLRLEDENEIPILVHGYKVYSAFAKWRYYNVGGALETPDDGHEVTVFYHGDGSAFVKIVPENLGKLQLTMTACFEDGDFEAAWGDAEVVYPDRKPEKFLVARGGTGHTWTSGTIYMDLSESTRHKSLDPIALYKDAIHPVPVPAKDVSFKLITATEGDPPISIDKSTGDITALHIGHALIQTTFEGFSVLTCVAVLENAGFSGGGTVCSELVPTGMTAPLSGFENSDPPREATPHKKPQ